MGSGRERHQRADRVLEAGLVESTGREQFLAGTMLQKLVWEAQVGDRDAQPMAGQALGNGAAGTTGHDVVFNRHEMTMVASQFQHERFIERFDEAHVDAGGPEFPGGLHRRFHHDSEGQHGEAMSRVPDFPLADRQGGCPGIERPSDACSAGIANGRRPLDGESGIEHGAAFGFVSRCHHHQIGNAAQEGEIEGAVMRGAILSDRTGAVDGENDRQIL